LFALGTENLGLHTRRGAGIMVQGVAGGAVFPPIQGAIADAVGTRISYIVPLVGFVYVFGYTFFHWFRHGRHIMRVKNVVPEDFFGRNARGSVVSARFQIEKRADISQVEAASY
jgi:MFS transporter, FHS family, L-fucose permease